VPRHKNRGQTQRKRAEFQDSDSSQHGIIIG
jgi:hypothetical protein